MKNKLLLGLVFIGAIALLLGCAQPAPAPAAPGAAKKPIKMRYSGGLPPTHQVSLRQKWFAGELQKRTNGLVTVEVYMGGELYGHSEVIDALSTGAVEMGYTMYGRWSERNPIHGFYNYFYLMESSDHFKRAADQLRNILFPIMDKDNVKTLHWFNYGEMSYAGNKPVVKPEDMKGLLIRAGAKETLSALKTAGAVPAQISSGEEYDALAKGSIDGTLTGWGTVYSRKQYEVTKYFTGPTCVAPATFHVSLDVWNKLDKDLQKTIIDLAKETEELSFKDGKDFDEKSKEFLKTKGTLTIISGELKDAWVKFARPTYDEWVKACEKAGYGNQAREIIKILDATR